jgi:hypothetical protein
MSVVASERYLGTKSESQFGSSLLSCRYASTAAKIFFKFAMQPSFSAVVKASSAPKLWSLGNNVAISITVIQRR